ncbi:Rho termination factor N-terminal domain-containing protein [Staphylococcus chromogenes]
MTLYKVEVQFLDGQDDNHLYKVGDVYPRVGIKPTQERIEELSTDNNRRNVVAISKLDLNKLKLSELRELAEQRDLDDISSRKKVDLIEALEGGK